MSHSDVSSLLNLRKDLKLLMENQVRQINDQKIKINPWNHKGNI